MEFVEYAQNENIMQSHYIHSHDVITTALRKGQVPSCQSNTESLEQSDIKGHVTSIRE